jgi:hypothetical protein
MGGHFVAGHKLFWYEVNIMYEVADCFEWCGTHNYQSKEA